MTSELSGRPDCLGFPISSLTLAERISAVRGYMGRYGKVLTESTVGNQLSVLINKNDANIPLYLQLACEQLRLYATYEELDWQLRTFPTSIPRLIEHVVARVESECGSALTMMALSLLAYARQPLSFAELHSMLDSWMKQSYGDVDENSYRGNYWHYLDEFPSKDCDIEDVEGLIMEALNGHHTCYVGYNRTRDVHFPPLVFQILLAGLRPLLSGLDENIDESCFNERSSSSNDSYSTLSLVQHGWIRFRSHEISKTVKELCLKPSHLPSYSKLGYSAQCKKTTETTANSHKDHKFVYWMLAGHVESLEHKVYYFHHAEKPTMVCRLLTSLCFLEEVIATGHSSSLIEDYQTYSSLYSLQHGEQQHYKDSKLDAIDLKHLNSMKQFICSNVADIIEHPFLIGELASNYEADGWIRSLGRVYVNLLPKQSVHIRLFLRQIQQRSMVAPAAVHKPLATIGNGSELPSAVTVSETGRLMAYGTHTGAIHLLDICSMRVLTSYFGHNSEVLSLCFAAPNSNFSDEGRDDLLWLISTSKDGSIFIWNASGVTGAVNAYLSVTGHRIASLIDCHHRSVTTCAWHPSRCVLATGSLDPFVALWFFPKSSKELRCFQTSRDITSTQAHIQFKRFSTKISPVASVAFRLPHTSGSETERTTKRARHTDILAAGCWNGFVFFLDMEIQEVFHEFRVSIAPISAMAFSPNGGSMLAIQDNRGQLMLYSTEHTMMLSIVTGKNLGLHDAMSVSPALGDSQPGSVCFSRPHGRYIIQSGASGNVTGRLNIWNAQLGAYQGDWHLSSAWSDCDREITACVGDPCGNVLFIGTNDGVVSVVNARTGTVISSRIDVEGSCVQTMCCVWFARRSVCSGYFVVLCVGYASGGGRIILCEIVSQPDEVTEEISRTTSKPQLTKVVRLTFVSVCHTFVDHDHTGGTLCMDMRDTILASGGEDAVCAVHYCCFDFDCNEEVQVTDIWHHLDDCSSAVTAVSIYEDLLAAGTKDRMVCIYRTFGTNRTRPLKLHQIHQATFDWVTALCWMPVIIDPIKRHQDNTDRHYRRLFVASRDRIVSYHDIDKKNNRIIEKKVLCEESLITTMDSKGYFLVTGSNDGRADVWMWYNKNDVLHLTSLDMSTCPDIPQVKPARLLTVSLFDDLLKINKLYHSDSPVSRSNNLSECDSASEASGSSEDESSESMHETSTLGDTASLTSSSEPNRNDQFRLTESVNDLNMRRDHPHLLIGQSLIVRKKTEFRFRCFIPTLPQLHTSFTGHSGITATGLATGGLHNTDADTLLVSMTGRGCMHSDDPACDIRFWRLSDFERPLCSTPVQHDGPVTCLDIFGSDWLVSGGADKKLIFWRVCHFGDEEKDALEHKKVFIVDLGSWLVREWVSKPDSEACTAVVSCMKCLEKGSMPHRRFILCLAAGREILTMRLEESVLKSLLENANDPYTLTDLKDVHRVLLTEIVLEDVVVDLVVKPFKDGTRQLWAGLINGISAAFSFSPDFEIISNISAVGSISGAVSELVTAPWVSCFHLIESNIVGIIPGVSAFKLPIPSEESLDRVKAEPFLANFKPTQLQTLCVSDETGSCKWFYLLASRDNGSPQLTLANHLGHDIVKVEIPSSIIALTATCAFVAFDDKEKEKKLYILFASTNGHLRLAAANVQPLLIAGSQCQIIRQIGIYPLGDTVIKILPISSDPPKVAVGTRGGRIHVFSIV